MQNTECARGRMEWHGRRRRGRCNTIGTMCFGSSNVGHVFAPKSKSKSIWNTFYSVFVMASLMGIIYLMLEHHCRTCVMKCNVHEINKSIEVLTNQVTTMKDNYRSIEKKITKFAQDLPKLEGQLEMLENIANSATFDNSLENETAEWNPKKHCCLPNVDVFLNHCPSHLVLKNGTARSPCIHCPAVPLPVQ